LSHDASSGGPSQPSSAAEEQKADRPAVQEESPANKRIQDFATRANAAIATLLLLNRSADGWARMNFDVVS